MRVSLSAVIAPLVIPITLALPSMACKKLAERAAEKAEEKAIEKQTGGQVSMNGEKGTLTIVTDAGAMSLGATATIPDDFPKAVPLYPGAKPGLAAKSTDPKGKVAWSLALETTDSKDKVATYYKANMTAFTQATSMDLGTSTMSVYQSPKYDVTLMAATESGDKTVITLNVASK